MIMRRSCLRCDGCGMAMLALKWKCATDDTLWVKKDGLHGFERVLEDGRTEMRIVCKHRIPLRYGDNAFPPLCGRWSLPSTLSSLSPINQPPGNMR
jgi:hypothetical protein